MTITNIQASREFDALVSNCEYHKKLSKGEIDPYEIPSSKLADGYDYTHLRRLIDYFDQVEVYNRRYHD